MILTTVEWFEEGVANLSLSMRDSQASELPSQVGGAPGIQR